MKYLDFKKSYIEKSNSDNISMDNYISSQNYSENMINKVEPVLNNIRQKGYIVGINNMNLYYEKYIVKNQKGETIWIR